MPGVRARFVRDVLDILEREEGREALRAGVAKLSTRIGPLGEFVAARAPPAGEALPASEAEELLLGLDTVLGDGSGHLLEAASMDVFARLVGSGSLAVRGDLMASAARLRAPLEHIFVEQHIVFDVAASSSGFSVFLGVAGRPRAARLLRHVAVGAVRAAQRFAREGMNENVRINAETVGDRVRLDVKVRDAKKEPTEGVEVDESPRASRRASRRHLTSTQPTLDTVERIMSRAAVSPVQPSDPPRRSSTPPIAVRRSTPPPVSDPAARPKTDPWSSGRVPTDPTPLTGGGAVRKSSGLYRMTSESEETVDNASPPSKKVP